jgi:GTP-sensing pleiotropic transcriptional regulator CodY
MALWCQFLSISHLRGARMGEDRLSEYLLEKQFPEDVVETLVRQYEMAMSLLPLYDQLAERATPVMVQ